MTAFRALLAFSGLSAAIYGVYCLNVPAAWITGGLLVFIYAELVVANSQPPRDGNSEEG